MKLFTEQGLEAEVNEGRTNDGPDQLGEAIQAKNAFNEARKEAMEDPAYHPAMFNRGYRGITG